MKLSVGAPGRDDDGRELLRRLALLAAHRYRGCGPIAQGMARGKFRGDPVFAALLTHNLLGGCGRILDLGCGQGLLAVWLLQARDCHAGAPWAWPHGWPAPPALRAYHGIDLNPAEVRRGIVALGTLLPAARLSAADIRTADYGTADAAVLLDVLHYIDRDSQRHVLRKVRAALPAGGMLLLRVGDATAGARFWLSQAVDLGVAFLRHGRWLRLHCRGAAEWRTLLAEQGFEARPIPMSAGTPFSNVLFVARAA
ncbi:MAG: class I SAM-dependent methyltransferase [Proteobacteria bacterium]|nr:class I SAM-dependent methyltransferase [Pseudomonadota bacterium]